MFRTQTPAAPWPRPPIAALRQSPTHWRTLLVCAVALCAVLVLSLMLGARQIAPGVVFDALSGAATGSDEAVIVLDARVPRTLLGLFAGAALGLASALMQALTRNPLADPGILGVNAGASFAVVAGMAFFGATGGRELLAFAFAGALLTTLLVYLIGIWGSPRLDPARFVLGGVAVGAVMMGFSSGITLLDAGLFDRVRFWNAGSLDVRDLARVLLAAPAIVAGSTLAFVLAPQLNALGMGDELAVSLGARPRLARTLAVLAITLLCGASTAVAGPIGFVGLMIPHWARRLVGTDQRWLLPCCALLAPTLLLAADIAGRVLVAGELRVSIVTAFVGAPVLIWLARRHLATGRA